LGKEKLMGRRAILFSLVMLFSSMLGCRNDSELTRSRAEEIIKAQAKYPNDILGVCLIRARQLSAPQYATYMTRARDLLERLQAQGVITYTSKPATDPSGDVVVFAGTITDKGKPLVLGLAPNQNGDPNNINSEFLTVKTAYREFGEITGIVEHKESSTADVQYTESVAPTPFGVALAVSTEPLAYTATFTKFDDGWRLTRNARSGAE
jgi:hypothetical protein